MFVHDPLYPPEIKLPDDLTAILLGLCTVLTPLCPSDALVLRVTTRVALAMGALVKLFHCWREGLLRPARKQSQRQPAKAPAQHQPPAKDPYAIVVPRRFGWLTRSLPETAIFAEQLQQYLADPEVADLFARCPQAGKILRPICRMLGVKPIPQMRRQKSPNQAPIPAPPPLPTAPRETPLQHPSTPAIPPAPSPHAPSPSAATPAPRNFEVKT